MVKELDMTLLPIPFRQDLGEYVFVTLERVFYVESWRDGACIIMQDGEQIFTSQVGIGEICRRMPGLLRVHNQYAVNPYCLRKIKPVSGKAYKHELRIATSFGKEEKLIISRNSRYLKEAKKTLGI